MVARAAAKPLYYKGVFLQFRETGFGFVQHINDVWKL